jgi:hypothetical protein
MTEGNFDSKPMRYLRVGDTIYQINDHAYEQIMAALEPFKAGSYAAEEEKGDCLVPTEKVEGPPTVKPGPPVAEKSGKKTKPTEPGA